jgi:protoheme IX farnesyltransferase
MAPLRGVVADYIALTKPKIILLLLVTALGSMFLAARGAPALTTAVLVMVGGTLGAGGANALNHYLDRDVDQRMARTRRRPIPSNRIEPRQALLFGVLLNLLAFGVLASWVNLLSALLTLSATLFYVFVYTQWLKRSTVQNIVIGGAAGAVPPMVGWVAVTGELGLPAIYLFAIVFFWTPPHFWALALLIRRDYEDAGIPMLPVVRGVQETARSIILHATTMFAVTILFFTLDEVGWIYFGGALALGSIFLGLALRLLRRGTHEAALALYLYSLLYLTMLFVIIAIDGSVG